MDESVLGALERILPAARAGRPEALEELCEVLRPFVENTVKKRMSPRAGRWIEAEDIVQGVLLETVRGLPGLPGNDVEELLRRTRRTVRSRTLDASRNHASKRGESVTPVPPEARSAPSQSVGVVTAADSRRLLEELVSRLPPKYAEVVRLCGLEGLSCAEAGKRLGLAPDTVRKRYDTAGKELARRLKGRDHV